MACRSADGVSAFTHFTGPQAPSAATAISPVRIERMAIYAPTTNTRQADTITTATSDVGRKTFQPRRISWS